MCGIPIERKFCLFCLKSVWWCSKIVAILYQLEIETTGDLKTNHHDMKVLNEEIFVFTKSIEEKTVRQGTLTVQGHEMTSKLSEVERTLLGRECVRVQTDGRKLNPDVRGDGASKAEYRGIRAQPWHERVAEQRRRRTGVVRGNSNKIHSYR